MDRGRSIVSSALFLEQTNWSEPLTSMGEITKEAAHRLNSDRRGYRDRIIILKAVVIVVVRAGIEGAALSIDPSVVVGTGLSREVGPTHNNYRVCYYIDHQHDLICDHQSVQYGLL